MKKLILFFLLGACASNGQKTNQDFAHLPPELKVIPKDPIELRISSNIPHSILNEIKEAPAKRKTPPIPSGKSLKQFKQILKYAFINFNEELKEILNKKIRKVYYTTDIQREYKLQAIASGKQMPYILLLNPKFLNQKINDWCKWQIYTAFIKTPTYDLSCYMGHKNSIVENLNYQFLRIISHIVLLESKRYPHSYKEKTLNLEEYPLFKENWTNKKEIIEHKINIDSSLAVARFYTSSPKIPGSYMFKNYLESLEQTTFPNLLASNNLKDDFIESLASYLHMEKLNQPYFIHSLYRDEETLSFSPCWKTIKCNEKVNEIKRILSEFKKASD